MKPLATMTDQELSDWMGEIDEQAASGPVREVALSRGQDAVAEVNRRRKDRT